MSYIVAYAKFASVKNSKLQIIGIYFENLASTKEEAEKCAKECVNNTRGIIIPKIRKISEDASILEELYDITDQFEKELETMIDTENTITRKIKR